MNWTHKSNKLLSVLRKTCQNASLRQDTGVKMNDGTNNNVEM